MVRDLPWPVATTRLVIRPARASDADAVWAYLHLPEVARWMWHVAADADAHRADFTRTESLDRTLVVARAESAATTIGHLTITLSPDTDGAAPPADPPIQATLGWALDPRYHGRGYATEMVAALLAIAFDGLHVARVLAYCAQANTPSRHIMERAGMDGQVLDDPAARDAGRPAPMRYTLSAATWRAARA